MYQEDTSEDVVMNCMICGKLTYVMANINGIEAGFCHHHVPQTMEVSINRIH